METVVKIVMLLIVLIVSIIVYRFLLNEHVKQKQLVEEHNIAFNNLKNVVQRNKLKDNGTDIDYMVAYLKEHNINIKPTYDSHI